MEYPEQGMWYYVGEYGNFKYPKSYHMVNRFYVFQKNEYVWSFKKIGSDQRKKKT